MKLLTIPLVSPAAVVVSMVPVQSAHASCITNKGNTACSGGGPTACLTNSGSCSQSTSPSSYLEANSINSKLYISYPIISIYSAGS